ncbi:A-kinase anchor protein 7 isoform X2 [Tachysurus fulvidraco]|uniref:A-kinase anchor protein 7 isoform X2 n=1 Tax=Tachysurus fulvidraco TaxID=1234273 RepID=UPI001FF03F0B|nr:A-kinase anchor protein 7 isoform X2 [Tachysurus fulvidraco]
MFTLNSFMIKSVNKRLSCWFGVNMLSSGVQVRRRACRPVPVSTWTSQRKAVAVTSISEPSRISHHMERQGVLEPSPPHMDQITATKSLPKVKRNVRKSRGRKQKMKYGDCTVKLLAELPFTNTEVWKDLGCVKSGAGKYDCHTILGSDRGFSISVSGPEAKEKMKGKKKKRGHAEDEEDGEKEKKKKKDSPRPNYFVSIPITNQKIKQGVEEVQSEVLQKDPRLSRALIPVGTLHVTLLVTHLSSQEQIDSAALAIEEMESMLTSLVGGRSLVLPFRGIGHFKQEVAFIHIEEGEHISTLTHIADSVRKAFEEKGIPTGDQKAFKPHLTFIKLSRAPKLRRQGVKKLDSRLYAAFEQRVFGEENVCTMDLCSMLKKKDAEGYYHREKTVTFGGKRGPEPDDDELISLSKRLVEDAVSRAVQQYMEETQQNGSAPKDEAPPKTTFK